MPARNHKRKDEGFQGSTSRFDPSAISAGTVEPPTDVSTSVAEKAEQATEAVGAGMESLGETIRAHTPKQGILNTAGEAIADKLESGGQYLESHGLKGIGDDVTNLIRKHPIPVLLAGVGLGFLLARMMRS